MNNISVSDALPPPRNLDQHYIIKIIIFYKFANYSLNLICKHALNERRKNDWKVYGKFKDTWEVYKQWKHTHVRVVCPIWPAHSASSYQVTYLPTNQAFYPSQWPRQGNGLGLDAWGNGIAMLYLLQFGLLSLLFRSKVAYDEEGIYLKEVQLYVVGMQRSIRLCKFLTIFRIVE